jgi:hypothetical protein
MGTAFYFDRAFAAVRRELVLTVTPNLGFAYLATLAVSPVHQRR